MKLSNLTQDAGHPLTRHRFGGLPASYLFVESVIGSGVLSETANNRLAHVMRAAINRLQNFLTPGASSDLEAMLGFFAPKGGGLQKVNEIVRKAGELQNPIDQEQTWWQDIFSVFNLQDPAVQQKIQTQAVEAAGGQSSQRNNNADLLNALAKNAADRQTSMADIQQTQQKINDLQARNAPTVESVLNFVAKELLNEADVKSNLRFVASNMMRRLGHNSTTPVQEVNWLKRFATSFDKPVDEGFHDFFRNLRMMAANPGHIKVRADQSQLKHHNERVAKLAVQYLSDWITQEMNSRLKVANLTPQDVISVGREWTKYQTEYQRANGQVSEDFKQRFSELKERMQRIVYALNPDIAKGTV